ncbi:phosphotransferase family protein [Oceanibium sediminis]|uniref:phosphotransferase family protein n=1 Tax=Oceanibium sediminis TaxID=2026339 RepID=UPI000DD40F8F|nr:phosphotransferase family protein [Oceanibium sediminis]
MAAPNGDPLLPEAAVSAYLRGRIAGFSEIRGVVKSATGQSNPTFFLDTDAGPLVLRRKPPGRLLKSAHAVEREFRVMRALQGTPVPVPRVYLLCEDEAVLGTAFFVMEQVAGQTENDPRCPGMAKARRRALYDAMNATLAALHSVDPVAVGLGDFGRPGNYFARQLARWQGQYRATETGPLPDMETLIAWLDTHMPEDDGRVALVHGDWRLDNLLFDPASGAINAVLDWELSTLGHPLADLGAQLMQWRLPVGAEGRGLAGVDRAALGLPTDADYVARYARRAGLDDIPDMTFPVAFSFFRMAAILQGVKHRALQGNASNPEKARYLGALVPHIVQLALEGLSGAA